MPRRKLPPGWKSAKTREGLEYYYNIHTLETTSSLPTQPATMLAEGWVAARNKQNGSIYYYHKKTRETRTAAPTQPSTELAAIAPHQQVPSTELDAIVPQQQVPGDQNPPSAGPARLEKVEVVMTATQQKVPGDRTRPSAGRTCPENVEVVYNADIKYSCLEECQLSVCCRYSLKERQYLYIRRGSIEVNSAYGTACCCSPYNLYPAWLKQQCICCSGQGSDDVRVLYFDRPPFVPRWQCVCLGKQTPTFEVLKPGCMCCCVHLPSCNAYHVCEFCPSTPLGIGSYLLSAIFPFLAPFIAIFTLVGAVPCYVCCPTSICDNEELVLMPGESLQCPCCCCANRISWYDNCCGLCGPPTGNPKTYTKAKMVFGLKPTRARGFKEQANAMLATSGFAAPAIEVMARDQAATERSCAGNGDAWR